MTVFPGRITRSPDSGRIRKRRAKLSGLRRKLYDWRVFPAEVPTLFNEPLAELVRRLATDDRTTADAILAEAQAIHAETDDRIQSAERRATTLQGTVAIAASLVIGGAGLLLDPSKVHDRAWRITLILILGGVLMCLIACAWRAVSVTGRMFEFEQPGPERIFLRAKRNGPAAQSFRAAELLRAAGVANEIGAVKVGLLRSAARWLRTALLMLALFGLALGVEITTERDVTSSTAAHAVSPSNAGAHKSLAGKRERGSATSP